MVPKSNLPGYYWITVDGKFTTMGRFEPYRTATARILAWSQYANDMHGANIMLRPTKCGTFEPVHTDPVC